MKLLDERQKTHGNYAETARIAQDLKRIVLRNPCMSDVQRESLDLICTKLSRIVCGNADEPDHWLDISGYAMLVHRSLRGVKKRKG